MNVILLSGGSGKRLWPLSNEVRSKQFIKLFTEPDGSRSSMLQKIYGQLRSVDEDAVITIATSKEQVSAIHNQLGEEVGISIEPCRRDTFPAIALATAYLHDVEGVSEEETVVVCPVDPYVDERYFRAIKELNMVAQTGSSNLSLMGIEPTYPSEKYGYIIPENENHTSRVLTFKEKPTKEVAEEYIRQGALWNAGVFAYKIKYVLGIADALIGFSDYNSLLERYDSLDKISFDYAVVEKEKDIQVMRFAGTWKDLGTWNTLTEAMEEDSIGDVICDDTCKGIKVINELDMPILCMGLEDIIISASPQGILVSDKERSSYIKPYVDRIQQEIMFAEKSWGSYRVIDMTDDSLTIKVTLMPGRKMNYHYHQRRDEIWNVVGGQGIVLLDDNPIQVKAGDTVYIEKGKKHQVEAITELQIIEVQLGKEISASDKVILNQ